MGFGKSPKKCHNVRLEFCTTSIKSRARFFLHCQIVVYYQPVVSMTKSHSSESRYFFGSPDRPRKAQLTRRCGFPSFSLEPYWLRSEYLLGLDKWSRSKAVETTNVFAADSVQNSGKISVPVHGSLLSVPSSYIVSNRRS